MCSDAVIAWRVMLLALPGREVPECPVSYGSLPRDPECLMDCNLWWPLIH